MTCPRCRTHVDRAQPSGLMALIHRYADLREAASGESECGSTLTAQRLSAAAATVEAEIRAWLGLPLLGQADEPRDLLDLSAQVDSTTCCPIAGQCAACGQTTDLQVTLATSAVGIHCLTLCDDCGQNGEAPAPDSLEVAYALALRHAEHIGLELPYLAATLPQGLRAPVPSAAPDEIAAAADDAPYDSGDAAPAVGYRLPTGDEREQLRAEVRRLTAEIARLRAKLEAASLPVDPPGPHSPRVEGADGIIHLQQTHGGVPVWVCCECLRESVAPTRPVCVGCGSAETAEALHRCDGDCGACPAGPSQGPDGPQATLSELRTETARPPLDPDTLATVTALRKLTAIEEDA